MEIIIIFAPESYNMSNRREKNKPRNTLNKQLERPEEREPEKDYGMIQLGKFCYSLAGLTYAGTILAPIINYEGDGKVEIVCFGVVATFILATIAWHFVKLGNIKR